MFSTQYLASILFVSHSTTHPERGDLATKSLFAAVVEDRGRIFEGSVQAQLPLGGLALLLISLLLITALVVSKVGRDVERATVVHRLAHFRLLQTLVLVDLALKHGVRVRHRVRIQLVEAGVGLLRL